MSDNEDRRSWHVEELLPPGNKPPSKFRLKETGVLDTAGRPDETLHLQDRDLHGSKPTKLRKRNTELLRLFVLSELASQGFDPAEVLAPAGRGRPTETRRAQLDALSRVVHHLRAGAWQHGYTHRPRLEEIGEALGGQYARYPELVRRLEERGRLLKEVAQPDVQAVKPSGREPPLRWLVDEEEEGDYLIADGPEDTDFYADDDPFGEESASQWDSDE